jgi:hypothetical protein
MAEYRSRGRVTSIQVDKDDKITVRIRSNLSWDPKEEVPYKKPAGSVCNIFMEYDPSSSDPKGKLICIDKDMEFIVHSTTQLELLKLAREEDALFRVGSVGSPVSNYILLSLTLMESE